MNDKLRHHYHYQAWDTSKVLLFTASHAWFSGTESHDYGKTYAFCSTYACRRSKYACAISTTAGFCLRQLQISMVTHVKLTLRFRKSNADMFLSGLQEFSRHFLFSFAIFASAL